MRKSRYKRINASMNIPTAPIGYIQSIDFLFIFFQSSITTNKNSPVNSINDVIPVQGGPTTALNFPTVTQGALSTVSVTVFVSESNATNGFIIALVIGYPARLSAVAPPPYPIIMANDISMVFLKFLAKSVLNTAKNSISPPIRYNAYPVIVCSIAFSSPQYCFCCTMYAMKKLYAKMPNSIVCFIENVYWNVLSSSLFIRINAATSPANIIGM